MANRLLSRSFNIVNSNGGHNMSGYINYEAARAHNEDLRREAARHGRPDPGSQGKAVRRPRLRNLPGSLVRGTRIA